MIKKTLPYCMLVFLFSFYDGAAQTDTLTLRQCLRAAQQNAVISSNFSVLNDLTDLKRANVKASNLPALSCSGSRRRGPGRRRRCCRPPGRALNQSCATHHPLLRAGLLPLLTHCPPALLRHQPSGGDIRCRAKG